MMPRPYRALLLAAALTSSTDGQQPPALIPPEQADLAPPAAANPAPLRRLVRHFDFEEGDRSPEPMPRHFYRYGGDDGGAASGFPLFGHMALTRETAASGAWSFGFELDGGSLAARIPTAVLPVMPLTDYVVTASVRTEGLHHARARIAAWLHDRAGDAIAESRVASATLNTEGTWQRVEITVPGRWRDAADLVVELQLVQPRQYRAEPATPGEPVLEDVRGRAWFDDVAIWMLPRLDLSAAAPDGIFTSDEPVRLTAVANDLVGGAPPRAWVELSDVDGHVVRRMPMSADGQRVSIELPGLVPGWYRAAVVVAPAEGPAARAFRDLLVLPADAAPAAAPEQGAFAIRLADDARAPHRAGQRLGLSRFVVELPGPVTDADETQDETAADPAAAALHRVAELLEQRLDVIIAANDPRYVADGKDAPPLVVRLGEQARRWQLGAAGALAADDPAVAMAPAARAAGRLARWIPDADVTVLWPIERPVDGALEVELSIAAELPPAAIAPLRDAWSVQGSAPTAATLRLPDRYAPGDRVTDLMHRTLQAWRAGLRELTIAAPWRAVAGERQTIEPDPALGAWCTLARHLPGRRFTGAVPAGDDAVVWLLADHSGDGGALVAWSIGPAATLALDLGAGDVRVVDAFGHAVPVERRAGVHTIELTPRPVFIEGADMRLAFFRSGLALEPSVIPAAHRRIEVRLVLPPAWPEPLSGTVRLAGPPEWQLEPAAQVVTLMPGEPLRLPLVITPSRSTLAGPAALTAQIELDGAHDRPFFARVPIEVGLGDVRIAESWSLERPAAGGAPHMMLRLEISNTGAQPLDGEAFVTGPQLATRRAAIVALPPGETAVRFFRLGPAQPLLTGGAPIYAGVDVPGRAARATVEIRK